MTRTTHSTLSTSMVAAGAWILIGFAAAGAQPPALDPPLHLPGDAIRGPATEEQTWVDVAPSPAGGHLAVWVEERVAALNGHNLTDIYGARLAADGSLIDSEPLLISTADHRQPEARVAYGGSSYLVVYRNQRTDTFSLKYDIVGRRVSTAGAVLDADPIVLARDVGVSFNDLDVAGDGTGWAVVWSYFNPAGVRGIVGTRITTGGTVVDPGGRALWFDASNTFGVMPKLASNGSQFLVVWTKSGENVYGLRLSPTLERLDAQPLFIGRGLDPEVASDGDGYYAVFEHSLNVNQKQVRGARISADGSMLDPGGVALSETISIVSDFAPAVAWDGAAWAVAYAGDDGAAGFNYDLKLRRVGSDGQPLEPDSTPIDNGGGTVGNPQLSPLAAGGAVVLWERRLPSAFTRDIAGTTISGAGVPGAISTVSLGLPRQLEPYLSDSGPGDNRLLLFRSQAAGATRLLAQRIAGDGSIIDAEPVELTTGTESGPVAPRAAWNGSLWLIVWDSGDEIVGRRYDAELVPLDAAPLTYLAGHEMPAVAALGDRFLVAGTELIFFNEPQRWLRFVRVAADGSPLDPSPVLLAAGFERVPRASQLGNRWLLVWESQVRHDSSNSTIDMAFVEADGSVTGPTVQINGSGLGDAPDIAVRGDQAFVTWTDTSAFTDAGIEARTLAADGGLGPVWTIVSAPRGQFFSRAGRRGDGWLVAWLDTRHLADLDEQRPDVWAARVAIDGTVLDPGGFVVAGTPDSEFDVEVADLSDATLVLFAGLRAPFASGHRLLRRGLSGHPNEIFADGFESGSFAAWSTVEGTAQ